MFFKVLLLTTLLAVAYAGLLDELGGGNGGGDGGDGGNGGYGHHEDIVEYVSPPKYEYKFVVKDLHTGDQKEKVEVRDGELTKSKYTWGEKDRKVNVARVIHSTIPVKVGKY